MLSDDLRHRFLSEFGVREDLPFVLAKISLYLYLSVSVSLSHFGFLATPVVFMDCSCLYTGITPDGAPGTIGNVGTGAGVSHVQSKHPTYYTIFPALIKIS